MTHPMKKTAALFGAGVLSLTMVLATPGASGAANAAAKGSSVSQAASASPVVTKNEAGLMKSKVTGTAEGGRKVSGTFTPSAFTVVGDQLMATGTLDAVIRGKGAPQHASEQVSIPVQSASSPGALAGGSRGLAATAAGSCDVLNLVLGPLDLNLLGLEVHLDQVVLDIIAQAGAGNLLGNLLCAVAGLLDGGPLAGLLGQLSDLLTQILGVLNA